MVLGNTKANKLIKYRNKNGRYNKYLFKCIHIKYLDTLDLVVQNGDNIPFSDFYQEEGEC
jgi:hypothetical protein